MRKFLVMFLLLCITIPSVSYAKEMETYTYNVVYNTDCDETVEAQIVVSRTKNTTISIRRNIPKKEGYSFLGWSEDERREPENVISAGQKLKIDSSLELFAVWKLKDSAKITYEDAGKQLLPSQVAVGEVEISKTIPEKNGFVFCGWAKMGSEDKIMPGEKLEIKADVVLSPIWKAGQTPECGVEVESFEDGRVVFELKNAEFFEKVQLAVKNLTTKDEKISEVNGGRAETNILPEGAYEAWTVAMLNDIEYKSDTEKFVVHSGVVGNDDELSLWMEGEELHFDMPPVLLDSYTYIALRHFCESMGAKVEWSDASRSASIYYGGMIIKVFENSNKCVVNGETRFLPVATKLLSGSMFIPLRSIAELCRCEIVWDESRKVYIFQENSSIFESGVVNLVNENGKFLSMTEDGLEFSEKTGFNCGWVFQVVDEKNDIYEIYNVESLEKPLMVKRSEAFDGQTVIFGNKDGFDGHLWRINKTENDKISIQTSNNSELCLGGSPLTLCKDATVLRVELAN